MPTPAKFHLSTHARQRAAERGITEAQMIDAVNSPDSRQPQYRGSHGGIVYLSTKAIGGRQLHVAAELYKDECFFVTGYWT